MNNTHFDLVSVGELLADFIGADFSHTLSDAGCFYKYQGGSPANLARNLAKLGKKTALVACVGQDSMGDFLIDQVAAGGVDVSSVLKSHIFPSSLVIVAKSIATPDFIAYRMADKEIGPISTGTSATVIHTTSFGLSLQPAQQSILDYAAAMHAKGSIPSIDLNYSEKIWPDVSEALRVLQSYVSLGALVKLSDDDAQRLFGEQITDFETIDILKSWGARLICLTKGAEGGLVWDGQTENFAVEKVEVKDVTGAGDAFWAGYLAAFIEGEATAACIGAGKKMAAIKLGTVGPIQRKVQLEEIMV